MTTMLLTALNLQVNTEIRDLTLEMRTSGIRREHILEEILQELKKKDGKDLS